VARRPDRAPVAARSLGRSGERDRAPVVCLASGRFARGRQAVNSSRPEARPCSVATAWGAPCFRNAQEPSVTAATPRCPLFIHLERVIRNLRDGRTQRAFRPSVMYALTPV
jgi:hypothetical protein